MSSGSTVISEQSFSSEEWNMEHVGRLHEKLVFSFLQVLSP